MAGASAVEDVVQLGLAVKSYLRHGLKFSLCRCSCNGLMNTYSVDYYYYMDIYDYHTPSALVAYKG